MLSKEKKEEINYFYEELHEKINALSVKKILWYYLD